MSDNKVKGYIVIASVSTDVSLTLDKATSLFSTYGFESQLPKDKKLSDIWERCTNVRATFRKDVKLNPKHSDKKVRFYTSKVKSDLGNNGQLTRHLVMEVVDSNLNLERNYDLTWEKDAAELAKEQRVNKPIAIMKYNENDRSQKSRFYWTDYDAKNGYGYLEVGEAGKLIKEINDRIVLETGSLLNHQIWKSIKNIMGTMAAYSLTSRGSAYFIPVGKDISHTRKTLKALMDLINDLKTEGRSSCTVWEVSQNPTNDYFGSASEILSNSLLELNERINQFATDVKSNKREKTLRSEWLEIQKHVSLFKGILGNKLEDIENSLKDAVLGVQASQYQFDIDSDVTQVLDSFDDIEIPQLDLVEDSNLPQLQKADDFEIDI